MAQVVLYGRAELEGGAPVLFFPGHFPDARTAAHLLDAKLRTKVREDASLNIFQIIDEPAKCFTHECAFSLGQSAIIRLKLIRAFVRWHA